MDIFQSMRRNLLLVFFMILFFQTLLILILSTRTTQTKPPSCNFVNTLLEAPETAIYNTYDHKVNTPTLQSSYLVSIIIPTYMSHRTIVPCIASILRQSYFNMEIIVVDDSPNHDTFKIMRKHYSRDGRIKLYKNLKVKGLSWSINFGITKASGTFIAFHMPNSFSHFNRIANQVHTILNTRNVIGSTVKSLVLHQDCSTTIDSSPYHTLLVRRAIFLKLGYLDSIGNIVAFEEFYQRIVHKYGAERLPHIDTVESVTISPAIIPFVNGLKDFDNKETLRYRVEYENWHKSLNVPYIGFPQLYRSFYRAQDHPREFVMLSMAAIPRRESVLTAVVSSLLPQVDQLNIFLNGFDKVPDFLRNSKITVVRSQDEGDLSDNGKFFFLSRLKKGYYFTADDDIIYPPNYVQNLILKIEQYRRAAIIGVHGSRWNHTDFSTFYDTKKRIVLHFKYEVKQDTIVHLLGTGTVAFHTDTVKHLRFSLFKTKSMADIWLAIYARKHYIPMISVTRERFWLDDAVTERNGTIFAQSKDNDNEQTQLMKSNGLPFNLSPSCPQVKVVKYLYLGIYCREELISQDVQVSHFDLKEFPWCDDKDNT
eukprot:TRINITY_DN211_c0_g3_i2.p1 TRINITY_DN211_c0_g3~~TRINITY_DN211_c0_g3_i2.p1  ORF type:complete len:604 (-),score=27.12 TRINITY_DN211_c0_g3_i2:101-1882(-)